jgi:anti-sigma-K factor RskA
VNIPLNNRVQSLQLDQIDASATQSARRAFEPRWNRWNVIRTVVAITSVLMLVVAVLPSGRTGPEGAPAWAEEPGVGDEVASIVPEER